MTMLCQCRHQYANGQTCPCTTPITNADGYTTCNDCNRGIHMPTVKNAWIRLVQKDTEYTETIKEPTS